METTCDGADRFDGPPRPHMANRWWPGRAERTTRAAMTQLGMSARSYHYILSLEGRILKLAQTIVDLEGAPDIATHHLPRRAMLALRYGIGHGADESRISIYGCRRQPCSGFAFVCRTDMCRL